MIFAAGIRPNVALAKDAGISVNRGIVVDDHLQTAAPDIFALGECAEHRGICYGLVEPAYEQARVLARHLAGASAAYQGSVVATNLKVSGVSVFSAGDFIGAEGSEAIVLNDFRRGAYKKLVISDGRLAGAVLVGDAADALWYLELIRRREPVAGDPQGNDVRPRARDSGEGGLTDDPVIRMTSVDPALARHPHRLSLLRRRLRRAGDARRPGRRGDLGRSANIPPISDGCARRARRSARRSASRTGCCIR